MTVIINYGAGNLRSVCKACEYLSDNVKITSDPEEIIKADHIILPGVGAFGDCMEALRKSGVCEAVQTSVNAGIPFLGICLGLQLLFEASEESPGSIGLGILKGSCVKIPPNKGIKIPHIGWNSLELADSPKYGRSRLFKGLENNEYVYFVHSYYMQPKDQNIISAYCDYSKKLPVAISRDNLHAVQFHPEKSGTAGLKILKNFIDM